MRSREKPAPPGPDAPAASDAHDGHELRALVRILARQAAQEAFARALAQQEAGNSDTHADEGGHLRPVLF
jgi:hypothetical protein